MKDKIRPFFATLIILAMCVFCVLFGIVLFDEYYSFGNVIIFSWFSFSIIVLPFVLIFPLFYFILFLFKDSDYAFKKMNGFIWIFKLTCIVLIVLGIVFSLTYTNSLSERGYIKCKGIPSGWMPGMATKYVTSEALCLKKPN